MILGRTKESWVHTGNLLAYRTDMTVHQGCYGLATQIANTVVFERTRGAVQEKRDVSFLQEKVLVGATVLR